jgi:hypothetical protein
VLPARVALAKLVTLSARARSQPYSEAPVTDPFEPVVEPIEPVVALFAPVVALFGLLGVEPGLSPPSRANYMPTQVPGGTRQARARCILDRSAPCLPLMIAVIHSRCDDGAPQSM